MRGACGLYVVAGVHMQNSGWILLLRLIDVVGSRGAGNWQDARLVCVRVGRKQGVAAGFWVGTLRAGPCNGRGAVLPGSRTTATLCFVEACGAHTKLFLILHHPHLAVQLHAAGAQLQPQPPRAGAAPHRHPARRSRSRHHGHQLLRGCTASAGRQARAATGTPATPVAGTPATSAAATSAASMQGHVLAPAPPAVRRGERGRSGVEGRAVLWLCGLCGWVAWWAGGQRGAGMGQWLPVAAAAAAPAAQHQHHHQLQQQPGRMGGCRQHSTARGRPARPHPTPPFHAGLQAQRLLRLRRRP